jgi:MFS superfamily sulfate permease-like transporter
MNAENGETGIRRYIPILAWLPKYQRAWLQPDFIAGLTIMALLVPDARHIHSRIRKFANQWPPQ